VSFCVISSDEVCHVFGPVDDNGSALDPFGLAADSCGRLVFTCLANRTVARFDPTKSGSNKVWIARSLCIIYYNACADSDVCSDRCV
jgi:hypothetical protein